MTHLNHDDRFGLVLFESKSCVHTKFKEMKNHKLSEIERILRIRPRGGTNFESGYNEALNMFENDCKDYDLKKYENRIIYLTDACPNIGASDPNSLMSLTKKMANVENPAKRIYTTFVGVGLDFNVNLVEEITKFRGANYFAVHSAKEFFKRLDIEFDYVCSQKFYSFVY